MKKMNFGNQKSVQREIFGMLTHHYDLVLDKLVAFFCECYNSRSIYPFMVLFVFEDALIETNTGFQIIGYKDSDIQSLKVTLDKSKKKDKEEARDYNWIPLCIQDTRKLPAVEHDWDYLEEHCEDLAERLMGTLLSDAMGSRRLSPNAACFNRKNADPKLSIMRDGDSISLFTKDSYGNIFRIAKVTVGHEINYPNVQITVHPDYNASVEEYYGSNSIKTVKIS